MPSLVRDVNSYMMSVVLEIRYNSIVIMPCLLRDVLVVTAYLC